MQFYKENDGIAFGSGAGIDDLLTGDCTIECYIMIPSPPSGGDNVAYVLVKGTAVGFAFYIGVSGNAIFDANFAGTNIYINAAGTISWGHWHHIAVDWDVGTLTARLLINGFLVGTDTAVGVYASDAAQSLIVNGYVVGSGDKDCSIGWIRFSDNRRYTDASFNPPKRNAPPSNDANAQLLIPMNEGSGTTAADESGNAYDGTITFGASTRWYNDPV